MIFPLLDTILLFFIYGFFGWCVEVVFVAITCRKVENRGFLNGPICPIYGFGMLGVLMALIPIQSNIPLLFLGGMFICSALEGFSGWILDKIFHMRWWDYSDRKLNVGGYICFRFSVFWGIGVLLAVRLVHPVIYAVEHHMTPALKIVMICIFAFIFAIDMAVTLKKLIGIRQSLGQLELVAESLHEIGDQLKDVMGNSAIVMADNAQQRQKTLLEKKDLLEKSLLKRKSSRLRPLPRLNKYGKSIRIEEYVNSLQNLFENIMTVDKKEGR